LPQIALFGSLLCVVMGCVPAPHMGYYTPPLSGRIIDKTTGQSIVGAHVVATERGQKGETVTVKDGVYDFPALKDYFLVEILAPTGGIFKSTVYYVAPGYDVHMETFTYMELGQFVEDIRRARAIDVALTPLSPGEQDTPPCPDTGKAAFPFPCIPVSRDVEESVSTPPSRF